MTGLKEFLYIVIDRMKSFLACFASVLATVFGVFRRFMEKFKTDNLNAYAAQASFFIFIALFPFLLLSLNLIAFLDIADDALKSLDVEFVSPLLKSFIDSVINEASSGNSGTLISATTITALWACSKGVLAIIHGLNAVYHTSGKMNFIALRLKALLYMVIFLFMLAITLVFIVFGNRIIDLILFKAPFFAGTAQIVRIFRWFFGFCSLFLFFLIIYKSVPERKTSIKREIPGALAAAFGWIAFSALFMFYIDNIANYANVYGSLTAIVLLMLWVYFCMLILFLGAQLNNVICTNNLLGFIKRKRENTKKTSKK